MDASDTIDIQAPNHIKLTVGGSSILITPGAIVITAGGGAAITLDASMLATSKPGTSLKLDANATTTASTGASLTLDATVVAKSKQSAELKLESDATLKSNTTVLLDGAKLTGTGKQEASFTVGGQSVKLTPASIDAAGATINVNGTGMVSIGAPMIKIG
jgi:hypothetical protein